MLEFGALAVAIIAFATTLSYASGRLVAKHQSKQSSSSSVKTLKESEERIARMLNDMKEGEHVCWE